MVLHTNRTGHIQWDASLEKNDCHMICHVILLLSNLHVGGGSRGDCPGGDQGSHSSFCELHQQHCRDTGVCVCMMFSCDVCVCVCVVCVHVWWGREEREWRIITEDEAQNSWV